MIAKAYLNKEYLDILYILNMIELNCFINKISFTWPLIFNIFITAPLQLVIN